MNRYVSLYRNPATATESDGTPLNPPNAWIAIEPLPPDATGDSTRVQYHAVSMRYHPDVTIDTMILYGSRKLFVKGVQNLNDANAELRVICEEVIA